MKQVDNVGALYLTGVIGQMTKLCYNFFLNKQLNFYYYLVYLRHEFSG